MEKQFTAEYTPEAIEQALALDADSRRKIAAAIEAFEVLGTEYKNINKLDYDLYEIKPKGVRAYFQYDTDRRKIIIVGFICLKETQKAPRRYMKQAVRNIEAYKRSISNDKA